MRSVARDLGLHNRPGLAAREGWHPIDLAAADEEVRLARRVEDTDPRTDCRPPYLVDDLVAVGHEERDAVAAHFAVSEKTVRRWIDNELLRTHDFGTSVRIAEDALVSFAAARRR